MIEPVKITPGSLSPKNLQRLNGLELDLLADIGVNLFGSDGINHRALVGMGWILLRRKYPDLHLSYEDAREHVVLEFTDDDDELVVPQMDPTESAG